MLEQARNAADEESYFSSLKEIQQIVTRDDPAAIYYAQPEWLTVLRRDIDGFTPDPLSVTSSTSTPCIAASLREGATTSPGRASSWVA